MASIAGKTKIAQCTSCGDTVTVSLYASPANVKCDKCKKMAKQANRPVIHNTLTQQGTPKVVPTPQVQVNETKPVKMVLYRNRQDIEGDLIMDTGEIFERVPTEWRRTVNKLDYLSVSKMETYRQCPRKFYDLYMGGQFSDGETDNGNIFTWFGSILHEVVQVSSETYANNGIVLNPLALMDEAWKKRQLTDMSMYKDARALTLDYFQRHPIDKPTDRCLAVEYEWRGQLGDAIFGCQFDYIGEIDSETAILRDYKSNRHPFTQHELEDSMQLTAYELILRKIYPQYKRWITGYEMFRFGWQQCPQRTQEDLDAMQEYINNMWYQITHDNTWEPKLNDLCSYCKGRLTCPEYADYVNNPKRKVDTLLINPDDIAKIEQLRETVNTCYKILDKRKTELDTMIKKAVETSVLKGEQLVVDGQELYLQAQSRPSYDYSSVSSIMAIHGKSAVLDGCLSINKTKLDAKIKDDPQLALELAKCLVQGYSAPYLMKRTYKPNRK